MYVSWTHGRGNGIRETNGMIVLFFYQVGAVAVCGRVDPGKGRCDVLVVLLVLGARDRSVGSDS